MSWRRGTVTSPQKNRAIILDDDEGGDGTWYHARYANCEPETADYNPLVDREKVVFRSTYLGNDRDGASEVLRIEHLPIKRLMDVREALLRAEDTLSAEHGDYVLRRELGHGAAGAVWRAESRKDGSSVAVKILCPSPRLIADGKLQNVVERFQRETTVGIRTQHPNVVQYIDAGLHFGLPFCVLELCDHSVADEIAESGRLPLDRTVEIVAQGIAGLQCLHSAEIVHRDVKPANILVRSDGTVCLGDLGIIHVDDSPDEITAMRELTGDATNLGSWYYMAPEQRRASAPVSPMADVYALGVTWYELLEGSPLPGPERFAAGDFVFNAACPHPLHAVISQMVQYRPDNRAKLERVASALRFAKLSYEGEVEEIIRSWLMQQGADDVHGQSAAITFHALPLLGFSDEQAHKYRQTSTNRELPEIVSQESGKIMSEYELGQYLGEIALRVVEFLAERELA